VARKPKRGRPPFIPTKEQRNYARAMVACGMTQDEMATVFHISPATLRKAFKTELKDGETVVMAAVKGKLVQKAMNGDNGRMFFLLKTRGGFRETNNHQLLGKDGQPISFDSLAPEALDQVIFALRAALDAPAGGSGQTEADGAEGTDGDLDAATGAAD
jgi:DNA-binding XRE family transcriptional regulator